MHGALPAVCPPVSAVWQPLVMVAVALKMNSVVTSYSARNAYRKALYVLLWLAGSIWIDFK